MGRGRRRHPSGLLTARALASPLAAERPNIERPADLDEAATTDYLRRLKVARDQEENLELLEEGLEA